MKGTKKIIYMKLTDRSGRQPAAAEDLIDVVRICKDFVGALIAAGLTEATCDSFVKDRCVLFGLSSTSFGVVTGVNCSCIRRSGVGS